MKSGKERVVDRVLVHISLPYATFGLVVDDGIVSAAPPIAGWCKGKMLDEVIPYFVDRSAEIEIVDPITS